MSQPPAPKPPLPPQTSEMGSKAFAALGHSLVTSSDALSFLKNALEILGELYPARGYSIVQRGRMLASYGLAEATGGDGSLPLIYLGRTVGKLLVFSPREGGTEALPHLLSPMSAVVANLPGSMLAGLLERLPEGVILAERDGKARLVNAAATELLGVKVGQDLVVGSLFVSPEQGNAALNISLEESGFQGECTLLGPNGSFPSHISGRLLEGGGDQVLWIFYDLSLLRQGDRARRRQAMLDAISSLAAGTAHELNNPLSGVMGFTELLAEDLTDDEAPRYLSLILEQVRRCQKVVRELLLFGQNHPINEERLVISEVVEAALEQGGYGWHLGSVDITQRVPESLPVIRGDGDLLQQAIFHIIKNAFEAMPDGGDLLIEGRAVAGTDSSLREPSLELSVKDTGEGIPSQLLERVLDPFFSTREVGSGRGMGLTIAYGIVREHGGQIDIESVPWEGTHVRILLPLSGPSGPMQLARARASLGMGSDGGIL